MRDVTPLVLALTESIRVRRRRRRGSSCSGTPRGAQQAGHQARHGANSALSAPTRCATSAADEPQRSRAAVAARARDATGRPARRRGPARWRPTRLRRPPVSPSQPRQARRGWGRASSCCSLAQLTGRPPTPWTTRFPTRPPGPEGPDDLVVAGHPRALRETPRRVHRALCRVQPDVSLGVRLGRLHDAERNHGGARAGPLPADVSPDDRPRIAIIYLASTPTVGQPPSTSVESRSRCLESGFGGRRAVQRSLTVRLVTSGYMSLRSASTTIQTRATIATTQRPMTMSVGASTTAITDQTLGMAP